MLNSLTKFDWYRPKPEKWIQTSNIWIENISLIDKRKNIKIDK